MNDTINPLQGRDEREAFEATQEPGCTGRSPSTGEYYYYDVRIAWKAWQQARAAIAQQPAPEAQQADRLTALIKRANLAADSLDRKDDYHRPQPWATNGASVIRDLIKALACAVQDGTTQPLQPAQAVPLSKEKREKLARDAWLHKYSPAETIDEVERACAEAWGVKLAGGGEGV